MGAKPSSTDSGQQRGERRDGRSERWREHRESRQRELVGAVVSAVREHGPQIGMDVVAAGSGIAKQVFYRYFEDKADLQRSVGRSIARAVVLDVQRAIEAESHPHEMLRAGIERYLTLIERDPGLYRYVVHSAPAGVAGVVEDFTGVLGLHVARLLGDRLREAGADAGAAEPWGFALVGSIRSAADRWLDTPTMSRQALADYLTEFAWSGLSAVGPPVTSARADAGTAGTAGGQDGAGDRAEIKSLSGRRSTRRS